MALSANTVWEVRTTGSDTNGGGFKVGASGNDYSQQDAAQLSVTDAACTGNTTVTSATGGFTSAMIGNIIYLSSGPGWYEITARTDTNTITIDRNGPNASGMTANVGGALASLGKLASLMIAGNRAFVKSSGGYSLSAGITFGAYAGHSNSTPRLQVSGYTTTRGDGGRPTITYTASSVLVSLANSGVFENFVVDCNGQTSSTGIHGGNNSLVRNCKVSNFKDTGLTCGASGTEFHNCEVTGGYSGATAVGSTGAGYRLTRSKIHANSCNAVAMESGIVERCLIVNNTGIGIQFFFPSIFLHNTIAGNSSDGIKCVTPYDGTHFFAKNNILASNGGYGMNNAATTAIGAQPEFDGNAYYSNTSGSRNKLDSTSGIYGVGAYTNVLDVTLSADPFTNAAGGDFSLNNTAGGGAACRGTGTPGTIP